LANDLRHQVAPFTLCASYEIKQCIFQGVDFFLPTFLPPITGITGRRDGNFTGKEPVDHVASVLQGVIAKRPSVVRVAFKPSSEVAAVGKPDVGIREKIFEIAEYSGKSSGSICILRTAE
jgi:hypothetical protein